MAKILVIDDDKEISGLLAKLLTRKNFEVVTADNGADGISLYRQNRPDLLITDIVMPEIGGLETVRLLKAEFPDLKFIAISGGALIGSGTYLTMAKQLGASYTFSKPFDLKDLLDAVNNLLA